MQLKNPLYSDTPRSLPYAVHYNPRIIQTVRCLFIAVFFGENCYWYIATWLDSTRKLHDCPCMTCQTSHAHFSRRNRSKSTCDWMRIKRHNIFNGQLDTRRGCMQCCDMIDIVTPRDCAEYMQSNGKMPSKKCACILTHPVQYATHVLCETFVCADDILLTHNYHNTLICFVWYWNIYIFII